MFKPALRTPLDPGSRFYNGTSLQKVEFTVGDFWRWALSDFQQNDVRGILGEFLVAKALGIELGVRSTWDSVDLITRDGIKIEVKAAGYLQNWEQKHLSEIKFSALKGRSWNVEQGFDPSPTYRADVYVFCLQTAQTHMDFAPLDLNQWEFRVLSQRVVKQHATQTISLGALKQLAPNPVKFDDLKQAIDSTIRFTP